MEQWLQPSSTHEPPSLNSGDQLSDVELSGNAPKHPGTIARIR